MCLNPLNLLRGETIRGSMGLVKDINMTGTTTVVAAAADLVFTQKVETATSIQIQTRHLRCWMLLK